MRLLILLLCLALPAAAQEAPQKRLISADEAAPWHAVGRLNIEGSFCTGTLIAENLVLTAAHCMYFPKTGQRVPADQINFLAGWRKGWYAAHRVARRVAIHPDFRFNGADRVARAGSDLALVELESPIRASVVKPFETHPGARPGDGVTLVSYARERSEVPAIEDDCDMIGRQTDVLVFSCDANFGASGAPIFVDDAGVPKIASVVSGRAQWNGRDVSLGASLGPALGRLMAQIERADPVFRARLPGTTRLPQVGGVVDGPGRKVVVPPGQ